MLVSGDPRNRRRRIPAGPTARRRRLHRRRHRRFRRADWHSVFAQVARGRPGSLLHLVHENRRSRGRWRVVADLNGNGLRRRDRRYRGLARSVVSQRQRWTFSDSARTSHPRTAALSDDGRFRRRPDRRRGLRSGRPTAQRQRYAGGRVRRARQRGAAGSRIAGVAGVTQLGNADQAGVDSVFITSTDEGERRAAQHVHAVRRQPGSLAVRAVLAGDVLGRTAACTIR